jgi:ABC-type antimicrobial peptide transport system permease subunit
MNLSSLTFKTESGVTLPRARVIYGTYGHLNAAKDNAVLLPSHYMADCHGYEWLGLVLAIVGVYGVMSYSVSQRTHEIGIRMALDAQRRQILRLVGRQGLWVVAAGLGIGMLLAFAVGELIQDFLIGIGPADAVTYTTISILLAAVAMVACLVPARRAVQVDPMVALRNE